MMRALLSMQMYFQVWCEAEEECSTAYAHYAFLVGEGEVMQLSLLLSSDAVDDADDHSEGEISALKPARFEFEKKSATLNMRIPQTLLDAVKCKANDKGVPFTRYVRMLIEDAVSRP